MDLMENHARGLIEQIHIKWSSRILNNDIDLEFTKKRISMNQTWNKDGILLGRIFIVSINQDKDLEQSRTDNLI